MAAINGDDFRIEKDALGELPVPAQALYGIQTQRAVLNFDISGLRPWRAFIWGVAIIKLAAAEVNLSLGLFRDRVCGDRVYAGAEIAQAIIQAAQEVIAGRWDDQFVVDPFQAGAGTSHHMNVNEVIANRATEILGGRRGQYLVSQHDHVNMSQSTNDVIPTAIRLGCLWRLDELLAVFAELSAALHDKAVEFDDVLKSGRTHLQDAVPLRLGQEFEAYATAVAHDRERLARAAEELRRLGIGGTAVGTGLNAHPEYHTRMIARLSEITGWRLYSSGNLFESMQSLADIVNFSAALRTAALTLIRIANDLRLLASGPATGLDEIRLPPVQPGSSIMPGKVNPVMAEMLDMAMFHIVGNDLTVSLAAQAGQLELNVMMPVIAHNVFEAMHIMIGAVRAFTQRCVRGIGANRKRAENWLARNAIVATALTPLVGYAQAAALVQEAVARDVPVRDVAREWVQRGNLTQRDDPRRLITLGELDLVVGNLRRLTEGGIHGLSNVET